MRKKFKGRLEFLTTFQTEKKKRNQGEKFARNESSGVLSRSWGLPPLLCSRWRVLRLRGAITRLCLICSLGAQWNPLCTSFLRANDESPSVYSLAPLAPFYRATPLRLSSLARPCLPPLRWHSTSVSTSTILSRFFYASFIFENFVRSTSKRGLEGEKFCEGIVMVLHRERLEEQITEIPGELWTNSIIFHQQKRISSNLKFEKIVWRKVLV